MALIQGGHLLKVGHLFKVGTYNFKVALIYGWVLIQGCALIELGHLHVFKEGTYSM